MWSEKTQKAKEQEGGVKDRIHTNNTTLWQQGVVKCQLNREEIITTASLP